MLTVSRKRSDVSGFTLVELMVALVVGLIVIGAVLALVVSIMKSNRQTIQATRLNQELRATIAVIANDLRRARGVADPLTEAKLAVGERYARSINYSTAGCVRYAYAGAVGGECHAIMRATTGADANRIFLAASAPVVTPASAGPPPTTKSVTCNLTCPTAGSGTKLGSDQVVITALTFTPMSPATPTAETVRSFDVTITGHLADQDLQVSGITRTITQSVQIRSIGAGN
jgi:prepilin-type N-terminal cleavage/methylation domain-containing protein